MTRFHNSRPCNGTATHSNELSETLGMPKCQPAPARVLLSKSTPNPSSSLGVLDTEMLPAVRLCLHSLHVLHTHSAGQTMQPLGARCGPLTCSHTHSLVVQENQPAGNGINVLELPRGASTL